MKNRLKKFLIFWLVIGQVFNPLRVVVVWADEKEERVIEETATEKEMETEIKVENETEVDVETTAESNTGSNEQFGGEEEKMETGDAVAVAESAVLTNSNVINSEMEVASANVTEEEGDIIVDLEEEEASSEADLVKETEIEIKNEAEAEVTTTATANTGGNSQETELGDGEEASESATMTTGDAVAVASSTVLTNTNLIESQLEVLLINLMTEYEGNIVLPSLEELMADIEGEAVGELNVKVENEAEVKTETTTKANSGENEQKTGDEAEMETGSATAVSNSYSLTNTTLINTLLFDLWINNAGSWMGQIYNWMEPGSVMEAAERLFYMSGTTETNKDSLKVEIENEAEVEVTTTATANTGGNSQKTDGEASMTTGNAYAISNTTTITNTNLINSSLFIGGINILDGWSGNLIFAYPDLVAEVTAPTEVVEGETINYQIRVKNNGYASDTGVAGSYTIMEGGDGLNSGSDDWGTIPLRSEVNGGLNQSTDGLAGKTVVMRYEVSGEKTEERLTNNWVEVETRVVARNGDGGDNDGSDEETDAPVLQITAKNNVEDFVYAGDIVTYDVTITNTGPTFAKKVILIQTFHPPSGEELSGFEVEVGDLDIGESKEVTFQIQVFDTTESGDYYTISWAKGYSVTDESVDSNKVNNPIKVVARGGLVAGIMNEVAPDVLASSGQIGETDQVLGVQSDDFIWWIPLVFQFLLTAIYLFGQNRKEKDERSKRWWAVVMGLMILSQFAHRQIGCGPAPTWACQRYWLWNLLIGLIQSTIYMYWRWRKKEET